MSKKIMLLGTSAAVVALACDTTRTVEPVMRGDGPVPVFSPLAGGGAGGTVYFSSMRDGPARIYRMNADGSEQESVTSGAGNHLWPDVSRNGRYLAYTSSATGNNEIMVMNLRTGATINVSMSSGDDNWARWSPTGHELVFHSNRDGNYNIFVVGADGSGLRRVTTSTLLDQWPEWTPNGQELLFRRGQNVWAADPDGVEEGLRQLTFDAAPVINQMAVLAPNGKEIAFMSTRAGYPSVWLMPVGGESEAPAVNLTPKGPADAASSWLSRAPAWSPNGKHIYFMSFRPATGTNVEIFVMEADGSDPRRLTVAAGEDGGPRAR